MLRPPLRKLLPMLMLFGAPVVAFAAGRSPLPGVRADFILVEKSKRLMTVYRQGQAIRRYRIALGQAPIGPKEREGDNKTPEGLFTIDSRILKSGYHRALHISYPTTQDVARARAAGYSPGGAIMIHGLKNGFGWMGSLHTQSDWTLGCIAVTNPEIEELWQITPNGTRIQIKP